MDMFKMLREEFPITSHAVYLNNAAESPLCLSVKTRLDEFLSFSMTSPHKKPQVRESVKAALSQLFGGRPSDYALVGSTGIGLGMIAAGFKWHAGDNIVLPENEHWNNAYPWYQLGKKGVDVRLVPVDNHGRFSLDDVRSKMDSNTRILSMAAVRFDSGFRPDLKAFSKLAHDHGAYFVVDGIQGAGVVPINVENDGIDAFCSAAFKWLYGLPGTGFIYVSPTMTNDLDVVLPGMFAAEDDMTALKLFNDARRFETGTIAYPFYHAWLAGLELIASIGVSNIHDRVLQLTNLIIEGLESQDITITTPHKEISERSAIIVFDLGSDALNKRLHGHLMSHDIIISLRKGRCRVSPAMYNTEAEIDSFLACVKDFLSCVKD